MNGFHYILNPLVDRRHLLYPVLTCTVPINNSLRKNKTNINFNLKHSILQPQKCNLLHELVIVMSVQSVRKLKKIVHTYKQWMQGT